MAIHLFRQPEAGEQIVIGADPAEGGDNSAFVAYSKKLSDVVMIGKSKEESSQLGHTLNHIGRWIMKQTGSFPTIAVERNTGSAAIYVLKELNYPALYKMPSSFTSTQDTQQDQYGWVTSVATRPKMLDDLALAVRQKALSIPSREIIDELFTFIRHAKTGKPQADVGCHDDLVIALAIALQVNQTTDTSWLTDYQYDNINKGLRDKYRI